MKKIAFIIVIVLAIGVLWQVNRFWLQNPSDGCLDHPSIECEDSKEFTVEEGQGVTTVANNLKEQEVIANAFWFKVYVKLSGHATDIKAGTFTVFVRDNYQSIVNTLIDAVSEDVQITIPEGYTVDQIGEVVTANLNISTDEWNAAVGDDSEGYLFPDTYRFFPNATAEQIVQTMKDEMNENLSTVTYDQSTHELLTLASIIEREVQSPDDMKIVSGIFTNRLDIGMALQADSTVNYVTGGDDPSISLADTKLDSPYNTYKYPGLPPGPISNPGLAAIEAAADPAGTPYFYFLTDSEGIVYYAETFDQHVANKALHLN